MALNGGSEIEGIRYEYDFEYLKDQEKKQDTKPSKSNYKISVADSSTFETNEQQAVA